MVQHARHRASRPRRWLGPGIAVVVAVGSAGLLVQANAEDVVSDPAPRSSAPAPSVSAPSSASLPVLGSTFRTYRVAVLGDSITGLACSPSERVRIGLRFATTACFGWPGATSAEVATTLDNPGFVSTWPGMGLSGAPGDLRASIADADFLVVGLGTNDALRERAPYPRGSWPAGDTQPYPSGHVPVSAFRQQIDTLVQAADGKPVYWYNLGTTSTDPVVFQGMNQRNAVLDEAATRWSNLHIVPWSQVTNSTYLSDEVHPNAAGVDRRWELLGEAIGATGP